MLGSLLFAAAFCVVALLAYTGRYSARVRVERSRLVRAPLAEVYAEVADLQRWAEWNPWPGEAAQPRLNGPANAPGGHWSWDGGKGACGQVTHLALQPGRLIRQRIRLQHPFAVQGRCEWTFNERDGQTEVRWSLRGRVGFTARAFARTIQESLALDMRYALDRLAARLEPTDAPRYTIRQLGTRDVAACRFVSSSHEGPISGMAQVVEQATRALQAELASQGVATTGAPMAVYSKTNVRLRTTTCHIGIPVGTTDVGTLTLRELPAHRAHVVQLQGDRGALELAWYLGMQAIVAQGIHPDQRIAPAEHYLAPGPEGETLTELHIPVLRA